MRAVIVLALVGTAYADGKDVSTPRYPTAGQALAAERFELPTNPAPGRLGSRYLRVAQDMFCEHGKARVVVFDTQLGTRIDTTLPCPQAAGLQLARYTPDAIGWFYDRPTSRNPFDYAVDKRAYLDYAVYEQEYAGYYVELDPASGALRKPVLVFHAKGYDDLYQATRVELATDDRSLDFYFHEFRHDCMNTRVIRLDVVDHRVTPLVARRGATALDVFANPAHTWFVLTGWLAKFDTELDPGESIFYSAADRAEFQTKTTGTVHAVTFDDAHQLVYLGGPTHADVWCVDLAKRRIDKHRGGFDLVNNILVQPGGKRLAILPSAEEYYTTSANLDHTTRHPYEPLLGVQAPYPWEHAMVASADGTYAIYTSLDKSAAVLTWR